jgi:hypothetical protein
MIRSVVSVGMIVGVFAAGCVIRPRRAVVVRPARVVVAQPAPVVVAQPAPVVAQPVQ